MSAVKSPTVFFFCIIAWQAILLEILLGLTDEEGGRHRDPHNQRLDKNGCVEYGPGDKRDISVPNGVRGEGHRYPGKGINPYAA